MSESIEAEIGKEFRRRDDSFIRNIAVGVISAFIVQIGAFIYFAGTLANQVEHNTKSIDFILNVLAAKDSTPLSVERLKTLVEGLAVSTTKLAEKLDSVASEQQRRRIIIDQMQAQMRATNNN